MSVKIIGGITGQDMEVDVASKAGRVALYDFAGNPIHHEIINGLSYEGICAVQDVHTSTINSMAASIAGLATWSGASESTLGVAGIQVNVFCDKRTTLTVLQSMDSANWDLTDSISIPANFGSGRTFQATASYFMITIKNEEAGASGAGTTRVQSCLCPMVEAVPRALTSGGNLRTTPVAEWQDTRRQLGLYGISSFRILGDTVATQNMVTIENPVGSVIMVAIRGVSYMSETLVALLTIAPQIKSSRATGMPGAPNPGTVLVPVKYSTAFPNCTAVVRCATASDGGAATPISATAGVTLWGQFLDRPATAVGNIPHPNYNLIPDVGGDLRQIILLPGEALLVQSVGALPATTHVVVNVNWYEMKY